MFYYVLREHTIGFTLHFYKKRKYISRIEKNIIQAKKSTENKFIQEFVLLDNILDIMKLKNRYYCPIKCFMTIIKR